MTDEKIDFFMKEAIKLAKVAVRHDEIPIGAVIVKDGKIIAKAYNTREKTMNAVNHAEVLAISKACKILNNWRLIDCDMFVTVEPCVMCYGALYNARIHRLYYGAPNKSNGEIEFDNLSNIQNHKLEIVGGVKEEECSKLLSDFFKR